MSNTIIRTNVKALNSHRNLSQVGLSQSRASQRLSSGFRINSAADDAAGLGISEKMRSQIRGLDRASLNAQDGSSLIQTAEGALSTINDMIIRMRELVVQAANDTNVHDAGNVHLSDRRRIQDEIDQIMMEINATAYRTQFNTRNLLDGSIAWEHRPALSPTAGSEFLIDINQALDVLSATPAAGIAPRVQPNPIAERVININDFDFSDVVPPGEYDGWHFENGVLHITGDGDFRIEGNGNTNNRISVAPGTTANIELNNVNITASTGAALDIRGAEVDLWLEGTNVLTSIIPNNFSTTVPRAGVETTGGILTIDGNGSLTANGANSGNGMHGGGAGIGGAGAAQGSPAQSNGTVIIQGGRVEATGGSGYGWWSAAGIGGGGNGGGGGNVIITGGIVIPRGGTLEPGMDINSATNGAAIGGGQGGNGGNLSITGGLVEIPVGNRIGGGIDSNIHGTVTVTGGNLSIANPAVNVPGGVVNGPGQPAYRVQVFLYTEDGREVVSRAHSFPPHEEVEFTIGGATFTAITDSQGRLFVYLPNNSQGAVGEMFFDGMDTHGTLFTMNADHGDYLVFVQESLTPPTDIPDTPYPPFDDPPPPPPPDPDQGNGNGGNGNGGETRPPTRPRGPLWLQLGANANQGMFVGISAVHTRALGGEHGDLIDLINVLTPHGEEISRQITYLDFALAHVTGERAYLGAVQNRLDFVKQNLDISSENLSAANSRIRDADMALEMMRLTQANVLQQAATAMLAQANQAPNTVLQLLQ